MEAAEVLIPLARVGMLVFVVASMLGTGLSLTFGAVARPLRDVRLVLGLLVANFVVVPATGVLIVTALPVDEASRTSLLLVACVAGAPFLAPLAKLAGGDAATAVGSMVLLMVVTVAYAPVVVPWLVPEAAVAPGEIAGSLVWLMILPLAIGLLVHARHPHHAGRWAPGVQRLSTTGLVLGLAAALLAGWRDLLGVAGTWVLLGVAFLILAGLAAGTLSGLGRPGSERRVLELAAAQRNIAAAIVIASSLSPDVVVRTLAAAVAMPVVLLLFAAELGRRSGDTPDAPGNPAQRASGNT
ncbi:bile acid:sodium symporter [Nocardioides panacisoli]|uniref:bile acid:sodium symporter family protein n=1 Tax=Nocardioides panacisoli TaxID=627624 RepID=UPI001C638333|nr:bile acid:sodium symporter [Nocardioides panacisoli]QYJ04824.1 bile acid:sodium symporter [Nocardioides panacisoli]